MEYKIVDADTNEVLTSIISIDNDTYACKWFDMLELKFCFCIEPHTKIKLIKCGKNKESVIKTNYKMA